MKVPRETSGPRRGWWNMACWNGLSTKQQRHLIHVGVLEIGYEPMGECERGAEVCVETQHDEAPGPRFYCLPCAIDFLSAVQNQGGVPPLKSGE